jgi:hypothetical protein
MSGTGVSLKLAAGNKKFCDVSRTHSGQDDPSFQRGKNIARGFYFVQNRILADIIGTNETYQNVRILNAIREDHKSSGINLILLTIFKQ